MWGLVIIPPHISIYNFKLLLHIFAPFLFSHCDTHRFSLCSYFTDKDIEIGSLNDIFNGTKLKKTEIEFQPRASATETLHPHLSSTLGINMMR